MISYFTQSTTTNRSMRQCACFFYRLHGYGVRRRRGGHCLNSHSPPEFPHRNPALVRGQEVHEAPVVAARHAEERQHRLVAAPGFLQAATNELTEIVARNVAREEHRVDVIPE